jgi:hypothetical protein
MSWLTVIKYGVPAAIVAFLVWATLDRFDQVEKVERFKACAVAASSASKPVEECPVEIADRVIEARRAAECEAAIGKSDAYAIRATCGEQAKRAIAERDAAQGTLKNVRADLETERRTRGEAIARAETRAATLANRTAENDRTIEAAPRRADGRVHCDAECVRRLAGD